MKLRIKWLLPFLILVVLIIIRILAPPIILKKINTYLADFSETYYAHIDDFGLSLWRGAYRLEKMTVALKSDPQNPFATATLIDVSVAWREIFRGRILTDVIATNVDVVADKAFAQTAKKTQKKSTEEAGHVGRKLFPVETERIEIRRSRLEYKDLNLFVDQIEGRLSNVTANENNPLSLLTLQGSFLGHSAIKAVGNLNFVQTPAAWVFKAEMQKFNVVEANKIFNQYVPLTFKKGVLDVYAEVKSEDEKLSGYVKPFLKDAEVIGDDKDFKGIKHFGVEITVAFLNLFFRSTDDHMLATKFLFTVEKKEFKWNMNEVLSELFKNGYQKPLTPGLENLLTLSNKNIKERKN